jgi:8-oxo-dGTP pyrophosphatase MutT (NUDIX family)
MSRIFLSPPGNFSPKMDVVTCVLENKEEILFLKRAAGCIQPFTWGIPGGKLTKNEFPKTGLLRELQEELSLSPDPGDFSKEVKLFVRHVSLDYVLYVYYLPLARRPPIILSSEEHVEFIWQPIKQIGSLNLLEGQEAVLEVALPLLLPKKLSELMSSTKQKSSNEERKLRKST